MLRPNGAKCKGVKNNLGDSKFQNCIEDQKVVFFYKRNNSIGKYEKIVPY